MSELTCPTCGHTGEPRINSRGQVRCVNCYALIATVPAGSPESAMATGAPATPETASPAAPTVVDESDALLSPTTGDESVDEAEASAAGRAPSKTKKKGKK